MIYTCMSVNGDRKYLAYAQYAIESFCKNNPYHELYVFTDFGFTEFVGFNKYANLQLLSFQRAYTKLYGNGDNILMKSEDVQNYDRMHRHKFVSLLPLLIEDYLRDAEENDVFLKLDCDAYFYGPFMEEVEKEIDGSDLYLVKREDKRMRLCRGNKPGVGFLAWRKGGEFLNKYINTFKYDEQRTIQVMKGIKTKIIQNEAMHIVYVQWEAKRRGLNFTKEDALSWLKNSKTAYFHCGGEGVEEQLAELRRYLE